MKENQKATGLHQQKGKSLGTKERVSLSCLKEKACEILGDQKTDQNPQLSHLCSSRTWIDLGVNSLIACIGMTFLSQIFNSENTTRRKRLNDVYCKLKSGNIKMHATYPPKQLSSYNTHESLNNIMFLGLAQLEHAVLDKPVSAAIKSVLESSLLFSYSLCVYLRCNAKLFYSFDKPSGDRILLQTLEDMSADLRGECLHYVCKGIGLQATLYFQDGKDGYLQEEYGENDSAWKYSFLKEQGSWYLLNLNEQQPLPRKDNKICMLSTIDQDRT